jgi:hypothetical protein
LSYKVLQLSPQASTGVIRARTAIQDSMFQDSWGASVASSREFGFPPSLLEEEAEAELDRSERNDRILGLGLSVAFSASVWTGVALIVTRFLR